MGVVTLGLPSLLSETKLLLVARQRDVQQCNFTCRAKCARGQRLAGSITNGFGGVCADIFISHLQVVLSLS